VQADFSKCAQKELDNADDHRLELNNLAILNHLKHPNIVELLASYTYQGKHNLLFPLAKGGTLAALLHTGRQKTQFQSDETFLIALAGLSSALEHVHDFFEHNVDLKLIGCHHDLRPQNILLSGTTLILADFGLSKFKESIENSATPFRTGMDDYLAPECEDLEDQFQPLVVRRSSDIWSFGCIIAEIAAYITFGNNSVREFRAEREFRVRSFKLHLFHHGPNKVSSVVTDWLSKIEQASTKSCKMLVGLTCNMLAIDQSVRPKASEITRKLRLIALSEVVEALESFFSDIEMDSASIDTFIEHKRLAAWSYGIGIVDLRSTPSSAWEFCNDESVNFESILECLTRMREHLKWWLSQDKSRTLGFSQLRLSNDHLTNLLNAKQQERSRTFFSISIIGSHDDRITKNINNSDALPYLEQQIRLSTALKNMTALARDQLETDTSQMQVESKTVLLMAEFGEHSIGEVKQEEQTRQVLVEWRKYGHQNADQAVNQELFARVNGIAKLLSVQQPEVIRALHCSGYFHEESRYAFGVLYDIPRSMNPDPIQLITLQELISDTTSQMKLWPILDDRFRLAYILAKSVLQFHLIGWLHKRLTGSNVIFLSARKAALEGRLREPYIIGFNHSRPDDPFAFTEGLMTSGFAGYQHPNYRKYTRGYRPEYDYYSLGVILLEIGFWRPLTEIVKVNGIWSEEHDRKLKDRIPHLRQYIGKDYYEAVTACINGEFSGASTENDKENSNGTFLDFETKVLSRLNRFLS
jgi:serine/threonine protein kinase